MAFVGYSRSDGGVAVFPSPITYNNSGAHGSIMAKPFRFEGKGLSIIQPWASAIAFAGKDIENRSWRTHYRGPLAIHASGKLDREKLGLLQRVVRGGKRLPIIDWINRGRHRYGLDPEEEPVCSHIVAVAMLVDCFEKSSSPWWIKDEKGWAISGVVPIEPIPWTGALSIWDCRFKYRPLIKTH